MKLFLLFTIAFISFQTGAEARITTKVHSLRYATTQDKRRINSAFKFIETVVNKQSFQSKVRSMTYSQTTTTGQEVLASILRAEEGYLGDRPGVMDMYLEMYYEYDGAIGYTYANDPVVYLNRWVQSSYTPMETAGNLFHEWLHKLGHTHSYDWTEDRADSVPYKVGYLMRDMAAEEASKGDPLMKQMMLKSFQYSFDECSHH